MRQLLVERSPHSGVSQVPRLRAETHFGVQAWALPVGLHRWVKGWKHSQLPIQPRVEVSIFSPH